MCSDADAITDLTIGGKDSLAMVGHAYMNEGFSQIFRKLMESEINDFGVASMFWEEFYAKHMRQLTFYKKSFRQMQFWNLIASTIYERLIRSFF